MRIHTPATNGKQIIAANPSVWRKLRRGLEQQILERHRPRPCTGVGSGTSSFTSSVIRMRLSRICPAPAGVTACSILHTLIASPRRPRESNGYGSEPYNPTMAFELVRKLADADFPTRWGRFRILGFEGIVANPEPCDDQLPAPARRIETAIALVMGDISGDEAPIVRIHSQCLTGDVFHSLRCDCRQQLELALAAIADAGAGILIYENQEGRGIGLMAKLQAYELQDQGLDTIEANLELGFRADCRQYELPAAILRLLGFTSVRLITNNPEKVEALEAFGITVAERIPPTSPAEPTSARYLQTKREKMGHLVS